jgi:hypothetical protein
MKECTKSRSSPPWTNTNLNKLVSEAPPAKQSNHFSTLGTRNDHTNKSQNCNQRNQKGPPKPQNPTQIPRDIRTQSADQEPRPKIAHLSRRSKRKGSPRSNAEAEEPGGKRRMPRPSLGEAKQSRSSAKSKKRTIRTERCRESTLIDLSP